MNDGDTHTSPVEMTEAKYNFLMDYYRLVPDSGGAGRQRGGLGAERSIRALQDLTISTTIDRAVCAPWGLQGGLDGFPNKVMLEVGGEYKDNLPNAKLPSYNLKNNERVVVRGGGGGGFGSPLERPADIVANDVRQGYVTVSAAHDLYGVVVDEAGVLDSAATERLRAQKSQAAQKAA
jgi:N-methylhydantoinase B